MYSGGVCQDHDKCAKKVKKLKRSCECGTLHARELSISALADIARVNPAHPEFDDYLE